MAKNGEQEQMAQVPVSFLQEMQATLRETQGRLAALELKEAKAEELKHSAGALVLDQSYEEWKRLTARPAKVRTQEAGDRIYGTAGKRWHCRIEAREGGKIVNVSEHPEIDLCANSPEEADGFYRKLCGIRGIGPEGKIIVTPVAPVTVAA
jgi:hypothetical protein